MGKRTKRQTIEQCLPQDIIADILVNLPVKPLLRFKCVSKPWRSLISSNQFTREHLKKSSDLIRHNLVYNSSCDYDPTYGAIFYRSVRLCALKPFLDKKHYEDCSRVTTSYLDSILPTSRLEAIIGSCNGLILVLSRISARCSDLILWNPLTRQVKTIPPPPYARRKRYLRFDYFEYRFGYDETTDDYKVVSILVSETGPYKTHMYSLRTNSWKRIGDFEKGCPSGCSNVHVNGKIYWLVKEGGVGGNEIIVSLNLVDEKYDIVPLRPLPPLQFLEYGHYYSYSILDNLGGYLCFMRRGSIYIDEAWVMMKRGEVESWTNIFDLCDSLRLSKVLMSRPIWLTKNGDIVVGMDRSKVDVFDGYEFRNYVIDAEIPQHHVYVESLVSPFGDRKLG